MSKKKQVNLKEIWPQERDFFCRPDRLRYVRKLVEPDHCVFCQEAQKGAEGNGLCVYNSEHSMVVLNKYPYNTGHILVLPTRHVGDLWSLSDLEYQEMSILLRRSAEILQKTYSCQGLNLGMNHGKVAGAGIPDHLHWHVIPRWFGDTNFFPLIAETKVLPESVEQTYDKLLKEFSKMEL